MWKDLYEPNSKGSENGLIIADEEYKNSCRITLEKCAKYYAITCGVYGAMVHTVFTDFENHQKIYQAMKMDLQNFIDKETTEKEELDFYKEFTTKY